MTDKPEKRTVYLVAFEADYEGYSAPEAAFFSKERAYGLASKMNRLSKSKTSRYEVLEVEVEDGL